MHSRRTSPLFVAVLMTVVCDADAQQWQDLYVPVKGAEIPCRVMKPEMSSKTCKYPVILSLHGAGGRGDNNKAQLKVWNRQLTAPEIRRRFPCYVVAPQVTELWNRTHYDQIKTVIGTLPQADLNRIYIMGHSMGGHGTFIFLHFESDYFAAAVPSAGTGLRSTEPFISVEKIKHYPIWAFHGDQDGVCPFSKMQTVFEQQKQVHGNFKLTVWKGDNHGVSAKFIPGSANGRTLYANEQSSRETDLLTWLFAQSRSQD